MASSKPKRPTNSVQDVHAMMNPEQICADLEKLYASRTNKENQSANTTTPMNNDRQSQVFFCGVDPGTTSSVFHRLYTAGASSVSRPPRKIGQPEPDNSDNVPLSLPLRLCGMGGSPTSSDIFTGIFAAGVEAVVETQDHFWKPYDTGGGLEMSLQKKKAQKEHELRVIQIAEDLKKEAPDSIKRENLIPMIKQSEKRNREKRLQQRRGHTRGPARNTKGTKSKRPTVTFKIDEDSDSDGYPSDIDEFLEFARMVVEEQNASFESTSYHDFEKALQETIRTHFLDGDDDDDSMTSMSSYSGLVTGNKNFKQKIVENKPASAPGIVGTYTSNLTMKPQTSRCHDARSVKIDAAFGANKAAAFKVATASISDNTKKIDDGELSNLTAPATESGFDHQLKEKSFKHNASKPNSEVDDDSILNLTEMMSVSTASQINSKQGINKDSSVASSQTMNSPRARMASDIDESSVASDTTFTTGSSLAVIRRQIESENQVFDKFSYDPLDNSLLSESSFKADGKIQKLPFRKEMPPPSKDITLSLDHSESETSHGTLTEGMKRTIENLAHLLAEGNNNPKRKPKGVDRDVVLQKLHDVAPHLYKAVLARMESERAKNDGHQHVEPFANSGHLERGGSPVATRDTIGAEKSRNPVSCTNIRKDSPTSAFGVRKQSEGRKAQSSRSTMNTSFGVSKPPLSPLKASSPITKVSLDEALEAASLEFDISRGSFWSDVLDVNEGPLPDTGEDFDPSVDDDFPSISYDDNEFTIPFLRQAQTIAPSYLGEADTLDTMIEEFLVTKIDRLNSLMRERQINLARMERVFAELQRTPASLLRKSGFVDRDRLVRSLSNGEISVPRVQRGRALIRKIQRKRQAMILARQQEEENIPCGTQVLVQSQSIPQPVKTQSSPVERDESTASRQHAFDEEVHFEEFLITSLEHKASASSPSDTSRNAIRHVREKRKMIRKKHGRSTIPVYKKALHESMDSALESEDTVCTNSTGTRKKSPPPKQPLVITVRKKHKHKECNYKPLPDQNHSFNSSQEMNGDDILQALAPPSPESPIRDYCLDTKSLELADDIACLIGVASDDLSCDGGRVLVFSDTEASDNSENKLADDFDPVVSQSSTTIEPSWDDEDVFVKIHKKDSPTSIADFFNETDVLQTTKVAAAYERVRNANYLHEDDQFVHTAMDLFMLRDEDEEDGNQRFDDVEFFSRTRFMI